MDTGDVLLTARTPIEPEETAGELGERLSRLGAQVLIDTLARLDAITPAPQRHEDATFAPRLKKTDGSLAWDRPARELVNIARGCNPWPGATTRSPRGTTLTIWRARSVDAPPAPPGTVVRHGDTLAIAAAAGAVLPLRVQPENRREVSWEDFLRGARIGPGAVFTAP
jgi:methionyl-tRNA formyltransferase